MFTTFCFSGCVANELDQRDIKSCVLQQQNQTESSGNFIIMFGSYRTEKTIVSKYYLYIRGNIGFRLQSIDSEHLEIVETYKDKLYIEGLFDPNGKILDYKDYVVYVPIGTITQEYKLSISQSDKEHDTNDN